MLHRGRCLADLVEEDGAAVGLLEETLALTGGPGEGAAGVAEELGLEQRIGQGSAALGHERLGAAGPVDVDEVGEELLARAGLAEEEHGRLSVEHLARELDGGAEPGVGAHEPVERRRLLAARRRLAAEGVVGQVELVAEAGVLPGEAPALGGPSHDDQQLVGVPRLGMK